MRRVTQFFACERTLERLLGSRAMLALMSEVAENEVREALSLPPFERLQCLLSKLAYYPDNPDFIAEIVISEVEMGRVLQSFTHPCLRITRSRRTRSRGDHFVGAGDEIGCSGSSDA